MLLRTGGLNSFGVRLFGVERRNGALKNSVRRIKSGMSRMGTLEGDFKLQFMFP